MLTVAGGVVIGGLVLFALYAFLTGEPKDRPSTPKPRDRSALFFTIVGAFLLVAYGLSWLG